MNISELEKIVVHHQEEMIKTQVLLYALLDELIQSEIIDNESLDSRIQEKIKTINGLVSKQMNELQLSHAQLSNIFKGPIGEA